MAKPRYTVEQVVAALNECHGLIYLAARRLGCTYQTIRNYKERHPAVREAGEQKRGEMVDAAEASLYKAIQGGEAWAVCFTLKTLGKSRGFVERQEVSGKDGGPIESKVTIDWDEMARPRPEADDPLAAKIREAGEAS